MHKLSEPLYGASFPEALSRFFKKYTRFKGYASRSEYWWTYLAVNLVSLPLVIPLSFFQAQAEMTGGQPSALAGLLSLVFLLFSLSIVIPFLALTWRRLHDAGFSGFCFFLSFVPFVGGLALLVLTLMPTNPPAHRTIWNDPHND